MTDTDNPHHSRQPPPDMVQCDRYLRGSRPVLRAPGGEIPPATHPIVMLGADWVRSAIAPSPLHSAGPADCGRLPSWQRERPPARRAGFPGGRKQAPDCSQHLVAASVRSRPSASARGSRGPSARRLLEWTGSASTRRLGSGSRRRTAAFAAAGRQSCCSCSRATAMADSYLPHLPGGAAVGRARRLTAAARAQHECRQSRQALAQCLG
jgi:hypothetical protein